MRCPKCAGTKFKKNGQAGSGRVRWKCLDKACGHRTTNPNQEVATVDRIEFPDKIPVAKRYIFTSAQNATPIHNGFFAALKRYAKHINAALVVIPFRYRNPTSHWSASNTSHEWWAEGLAPFMYDGRFDLHKHLTILADIKVQPTATSPLTGLEGITAERSAILGHPKIQFHTIPTPHHKLPKIMCSTGAVTRENYTDSKAGKKGEFHHSFGATIVELAPSGSFHLRQIIALHDGSFIDLDKEVTAKRIKKAPPAEAIVMGDTHVDFVDPAVVKATFVGKNSMCAVLRPKRLVWHDLIDFYSRNHHHRGDPITTLVKHKTGMGDVRNEVIRACAFVDKYAPKGVENVLVPSNHPEAMMRWIKETDWRGDPENAEFYLETALALVKAAKMTDAGATTVDPFVYWARQLIKSKAVMLDRDESYAVKKIELGMHGDKGPNGSRGSIKSFARIGPRSMVGHTHAPGIFEGCMQVGTSTYLKLEYTSGPSSWMQSHGVIYANGKRSLINFVKGDWRS